MFNGVHLLVPNNPTLQIVGDACPSGYGCWNPELNQYISEKFPLQWLDPTIPIHLKEFMCVILATKNGDPNGPAKQFRSFVKTTQCVKSDQI